MDENLIISALKEVASRNMVELPAERHVLDVPAAMEAYAKAHGAQTNENKNAPEWFYIGTLPVALEELVKKAPTRFDFQMRSPQCPVCGGQMKLLPTKDGLKEFWGCMSYTRCKGIRNAQDPLAIDAENQKKPKQRRQKVGNIENTPLFLLMKFATEVLGGVHVAKRWFITPKMYELRGKTPYEVVATKEGQKKVRLMLEELRLDSKRAEKNGEKLEESPSAYSGENSRQ